MPQELELNKHKIEYSEVRNIGLECFGTICLAFFTNWANILYITEKLGLATYSMIFGLTTSVMIYVGAHRSGAHFDPAVSLSTLANGQMGVFACVIYICMQILGGLIAGLLIDTQLPDELRNAIADKAPLGVPTPNENLQARAFILEMIAVMIIQMVRVAMLVDSRGNKEISGMAIGAISTCMLLTVAPITGGCFNPARSIGPLIVFSGKINGQWLMVGAPFLGNYLGFYLYKTILMSTELKEELEDI